MRLTIATMLRRAALAAVAVARRLDPPRSSTFEIGDSFNVESPRQRASRLARAVWKVN